MKKQDGFTVAELVVSIAVMALILGGIVSIFGTSMRSLVLGHNQAAAYAEARDVMNDLKTTLRYADSADIDATQLASGKLTYHGKKVKDLTKGIAASEGEAFSRTVEWANTDHTQIKITKEDNNNPAVTVYFPQNVKNHAFDSDDYKKVYKEVYGSNSGNFPFPIFTADFEGQDMYNIILPIKYSAMGITKVDVLQSRVSPADPKDVADIGGGGGTSTDTTSGLNYLLEAVSEQFAEKKTGLSQEDMVSKIDSGSLKTKGQAGATKSVNDYLKEHQTSAGDSYFDLIKNRSWTIVPLNGGGQRVKSYKATKYWSIYIAKNVEDDVICNSDGSVVTKGYYNNQGSDYLKWLAEEKERYIIRDDWNFLVYHGVYNVDGTLITDEKIIARLNATETLGYAKGIKTGDNRIIDYATWTTNYNNILTSPDQRIDYDKTGKEYTKATATAANKNYYYPASLYN